MNDPLALPIFRSVQELRMFALEFDGQCPPVTVDMGVLDLTPFAYGWLCTLIDFSILTRDIRCVRHALDHLDNEARAEFVFLLCVFNNGDPEDVPFTPGMRVVYDVRNVNFFNHHCIGSVRLPTFDDA